LNTGTKPWANPPILFCNGFFQDRVLQTICPGWPQTSLLLIFASWVARITGVSHQPPAWRIFLVCKISYFSVLCYFCINHILTKGIKTENANIAQISFCNTSLL
jgi:hypothetical protein